MSSFSRSKNRGHYPDPNHGGGHYKRPHGSGGILGKIFEALTGSSSRRHSLSGSNRHNRYSSSHHRKSSWS
ncbi:MULTISPECIES: hypothetical protein [Desulfosporosinus]|uniref:hypothetical protein n=1 Tax=Desulfosporosinus TaxID=79206 RepID=UPI001124D80A|nr:MULTISPECIES: hypothetical protein [Desulfosporosinus]